MDDVVAPYPWPLIDSVLPAIAATFINCPTIALEVETRNAAVRRLVEKYFADRHDQQGAEAPENIK
ncbi:hypothetical protein ACMAZH_05810 [Arenicellales bacterium nBUS_45]